MKASLLIAAASVLGSLACATEAAAYDRNEANFSVDVRDYYLHTMPGFSFSDPLITPLRSVSGNLPSTGEQHFLALGIDTTFIRNNTWEFPLFGFVVGGAVGQSPSVVSSLNGSLVYLRPWTAGMMSVLLPGVGLRTNLRRWKFSIDVRTAVSFTWMGMTVANGSNWIDPTNQTDGNGNAQNGPFAITFGVHGNVEACRRLEPTERLCLFVEPHLYEYTPFNGASAGLRWEVGP